MATKTKKTTAKKITGAEIFVKALEAEGVTDIFGYPGGAVLPIYHALYDSKILKHYLVRHEQGAVHMADGYARSTGRPGVALATSGPGATNTVTGIATAYMDSIPMVVFTGQVPTSLIGNDAFQEADIVGITRPCTKHNYLVKDVKDLAGIIKEAFHIATTGRPGPVLIDIPKDVSNALCEFNYSTDKHEMETYQPRIKGHSGQLKKALEIILKSKRPVVYAGGGAILSGAEKELTKFVDLLNIPTTLTLMGLGAYPAHNKNFMGMLGMHGTYAANMAISNCDCLIAIGSRFDDRVTGKVDEFAPFADIIHIDIDPTSISKNVTVDVPIVGDVKNVLKDMLKELGKKKSYSSYHKQTKDWTSKVDGWQKDQPLKTNQSGNEMIKPQFVIDELDKLTNGDAIISTDVGQHQMWTAQFYKFNKSKSFLTSGGLGTMGFGLPAAIGAQVAHPKSQVICISGDGSIQMNSQEFMTAVEYKLPVKTIILNNNYLGMVRQWQGFFHEKRYSHSLISSPDYKKLIEAYGGVGFKCENVKDVKKTLQDMLKIKDKPVVVEFKVQNQEDVYPMVPAGGALNKMLLV